VDVVRPSGNGAHPGKLLAGPALSLVLAQARSCYDLVLIDAPSPLTASDTWLLVEHVDGVILVARLARARRGRLLALRDELEASRTPIVGVIATGARGEAAQPGPQGFQPRAADPHASGFATSNGHAPVAASAVSSRGPV
jgi:Mrp family chromosome partitioning ATPase